MTDHKNIERICAVIAIVTILIGFVFSYYGDAIGITSSTADLSYVTTLFDDSSVHNINIEISDENWNDLQENATDEDYQLCNVTVDGETLDNVAIRPKGNSSLSSVASTDSERYSFKIDFNKYTDGLTYHGLDKLNLNNIISDNTYLKDYLSYDMMKYMGVDAPLTSFVRVSVNGEYFGLYLAVEGVEEAFAERNYGSDVGNIYKPDSMEIGGDNAAAGGNGQMPDMSNLPTMPQRTDTTQTTDTNQADTTQTTDTATQTPDMSQMPDISQMGNMGGTSGNDVALIYSDDNLSSYENIWNGAVFDVTTSDKERLISSIKQLNEGENLDEVVDVDEVLKYFVVHTFVDNFDSYTSSMKHNYYLREVDGQLSIIAWDYNLAFSNFSGGGMGGGAATTSTTTSTDEATTLVNYPIDTPVSGTTMEDRPLLNELLSNETYLEQYHQYYEEFISGYFDSGRYEETIDKAVALISEDVKTDPTAFCTYQEYEDGVAVLKQFCALRAESISGQLDGTIPSTTDGQAAQSSTLVNASSIDISAMGGTMGGGMDNGLATTQNSQTTDAASVTTDAAATTDTQNTQRPANFKGGGQPPANMTNTNTATASNDASTGTTSSTTNETETTADATTPTGNFPAGQQNTTTTTNWDMNTIILIGVSCLLLVGGILLTKIYKR